MWREKVKRLIFVRADQIIPRRGILMLYSRQLVFTLSFVSLYELYSALFWIYFGNGMDFIRPGGLSCHYWLTRTDLAEEARNHAGFATIAGWLTGLILRILDLSLATISKLIVCPVLCERWVMTRRHKSAQILELGSSEWSNNTTWAQMNELWSLHLINTLQLIYSAINKMIMRDKAGPLNFDKRKNLTKSYVGGSKYSA